MWRGGVGSVVPQKEARIFFEKKKQKTFVS